MVYSFEIHRESFKPQPSVFAQIASGVSTCVQIGKACPSLRMRPISRWFAVLGQLLLVIGALIAPAAAANSPSASAEDRTAAYFQSIREDPNRLLVFLRAMPKGGDLHNHLLGAVYAESFIQWASESGLCVHPRTLFISPSPCGGEEGTVPAAKALSDPILYREMVDAYSMRNWQLSGESGHDWFFDTFDKFIVASFGNTGKMLAETAARAALQREVYQELMHAAAFPQVLALANRSGWDDDLARQRDRLLANGMMEVVAASRKEMDDAEAVRNSLLKCGTAQPDPGCMITQRYQYMVLRAQPKEVVFAQMLLGFEAATADPRFVALNLVQPEDWYVPMRDFPLHMRMMRYLHSIYPKVHVALHAGELAPGLVPPEEMRFHIRASVEMGGAERIGHGMDVLHEDRPNELLRELATRKVMIEICLTSNATILGVQGDRHPLGEYIRAGVPVALATDDEAVSRSDMTHEYLRGAQDQRLSYLQLKKMARTSLEYAFIAGASLWRDGSAFTVVKECAGQEPGGEKPSETCRKLLDGSEKARLQWKLETQFREFESQPWATPTSISPATTPARPQPAL